MQTLCNELKQIALKWDESAVCLSVKVAMPAPLMELNRQKFRFMHFQVMKKYEEFGKETFLAMIRSQPTIPLSVLYILLNLATK